MSRVAVKDSRSTTGRNLTALATEFNLDPWSKSAACFKQEYVGYMVPEMDRWRLHLLEKLLVQRREMVVCEEEVQAITNLIDSLCSS